MLGQPCGEKFLDKMKMSLLDVSARVWEKTPSVLRRMFHWLSIGDYLARLLMPDKLENVEIKEGIAKGMILRINPRRERPYLFGTYEEDVQAALRKSVYSGMTVFNIGANSPKQTKWP